MESNFPMAKMHCLYVINRAPVIFFVRVEHAECRLKSYVIRTRPRERAPLGTGQWIHHAFRAEVDMQANAALVIRIFDGRNRKGIAHNFYGRWLWLKAYVGAGWIRFHPLDVDEDVFVHRICTHRR